MWVSIFTRKGRSQVMVGHYNKTIAVGVQINDWLVRHNQKVIRTIGSVHVTPDYLIRITD